MLTLPAEAERNLRHMGHQVWVDNLQEHTGQILEEFRLQPLKVLEGGVSGLVFLAETPKKEKVVIKTQPTPLGRALKALECSVGDPFLVCLLDKDEQLNTLVLAYEPSVMVTPDALQLQEVAPMLSSWQQLDASQLIPFDEYLGSRFEHTQQRTAVLEDLLDRGELNADKTELFEHSKIRLELIKEITEPAKDRAMMKSNFVHCDFGPHNLLRKTNGKLIAVDAAGVRGDGSYDVGSAGLTIGFEQPLQAAERVKRLAAAVGVEEQEALIWGAFRANFSAISLCTRENREDHARMLVVAADTLLAALGL